MSKTQPVNTIEFYVDPEACAIFLRALDKAYGIFDNAKEEREATNLPDEEFVKAAAELTLPEGLFDVECLWSELEAKGIEVIFSGMFEGGVTTIPEAEREMDSPTGINEDIDYGESIMWLPIDKDPSLFEKAYNDVDDIVWEMQQKFRNKCGHRVLANIPDEFDWAKRICRIYGVV